MVVLSIVLIVVIALSTLFILIMSDEGESDWTLMFRLEASMTISIAIIILIVLKIITPEKTGFISSVVILTVALCLSSIYFYRNYKKLKIVTITDMVAELEKYTEADYDDLCKKIRCISKIKNKYRRLYRLHISPLYKTIKLEKVFTTKEVKEAFRNELLTQKIDMFREAVDETINELKAKDKALIRILSKI